MKCVLQQCGVQGLGNLKIVKYSWQSVSCTVCFNALGSSKLLLPQQVVLCSFVERVSRAPW